MSLLKVIILLGFFPRAVEMFTQSDGGFVHDGGVVPPAASPSGGLPTGVYEVNFVIVSIIVGVVLTVALVYLIRRLTPR